MTTDPVCINTYKYKSKCRFYLNNRLCENCNSFSSFLVGLGCIAKRPKFCCLKDLEMFKKSVQGSHVPRPAHLYCGCTTPYIYSMQCTDSY